MIGALMDRRVTVIHNDEVGTDRLNTPVYGEVGRDDNVPARIEQSGSVEGSEYVSGKWVGYFAPGTAIGSRDVILDEGHVMAHSAPEVVGGST